MPSNRRYRSALVIIQSILEELVKNGRNEGLVKSHIYKEVGLKTSVGEKYLEELAAAGYLQIAEVPWGEQRVRHIVNITSRGIQRFEWFLQLSEELDL